MRVSEGQVWKFLRSFLKGSGEHLAAFFMKYGQISGATSDNLCGGWSIDIMIDRLAFVSLPNCLDF